MTQAERKAQQRREARKAGLCPICCVRKPSPAGYATCQPCRDAAAEYQADHYKPRKRKRRKK